MRKLRRWTGGTAGWGRYLTFPLVVWLVAMAALAGGLGWAQQSSEQELRRRFALRVSIGSDFLANHVKDQIDRVRVQATEFLSAPAVEERQLQEISGPFGYTASVLLDERGRLLQVVPANAALLGTDLAVRYDHLLRAVRDGQPVVSRVVPSAVEHVPVVAFAVPFDTPGGRRVFSGALAVQQSSLGSYLDHAIALPSSRAYLLDPDGKIVATDGAVTETLGGGDPALAGAMRDGATGGYREADRDWFFASRDVPGTPWRLVATVPAPVLFVATRDPATWRLYALGAMAVAGLLAVVASARGRRGQWLLRESEQRFRQVFDHSLIGMILTNQDGRLARVNPAFAAMLGYSTDQLTGRSFADLTHADDVETGQDLLRDSLAGRISEFTVEKRYVHADGHAVDVQMSAALVRDHNGAPLHFATQVIDLSDRKRWEAEQAAANAALREAHHRVADLVGMLSHDVRQPLGVITGYVDTMTEDWDLLTEPRRLEFLGRVSGAARRMSIMVEDILALTHLDAGTIQPRRATVELRRAVTDAIDLLPAQDATAVTVDLGEHEAFAVIDPGHLQQILLNLVGNAFKYGDPPVDVRLSAGAGAAEITVTDRGSGVPVDFVPHLFDRFARATTGVAVTKAGTGLGLFIVAQLAEVNTATVSYQPNDPAGARFTLRMPAVSGS